MPGPVFKLAPTTQQYDWGKVGRDSKVAQLAEASKISGFTLDETAPYAELWMGTHPKSPSLVLDTAKPLSEHLAAHPDLIGKTITQRFERDYGTSGGNLPFLFKVLSIHKALSIQTHPDKATAEELHRTQGDIYKDPNHKPEMALALTPFLALCGFQPLPRIAANLKATPEAAALIPPNTLQTFLDISSSVDPTGPKEKNALKALFEALMTAEAIPVRQQLNQVVARYKKGELREGEQKDVVDLVLRLDTQFPEDIGIFCAYVLNQVRLSPGEAIFLGAGEPHAYVEGDIMECMANSDNVIRAGLTPKLRDIPNLISGLSYTAAPPSNHVVNPRPFGNDVGEPSSTLYDPPIPEFSVVQLALPSGSTESHRAIDGPSIAVVTEGSGNIAWGTESLDVSTGDVFFVGAKQEIRFSASGEKMVAYRAFVETS
ncbi:hypothetical protein HGRIS_005247 [Hohenbuehelia grisea]|uniref:Mannose-6-phosphate isomerase n=1 Tax=Hohenbuehelia grisea TaxID=104357 RepID=A0ABR3JG17_9AGAR